MVGQASFPAQPFFSNINENGRVETDAAIMDGRELSAGAVAAVENISNPAQLARLVMARTLCTRLFQKLFLTSFTCKE